ncbi:MAG TPA: class I SAM-dependent methyltransferase [Chitinophagales bacterium]|nr:class I SAM-dependent methyltransferase [Chitinophagales bacterium]
MSYLKSITTDKQQAKEYFEKSVIKTEQQKFLEELLTGVNINGNINIADIACGGGTLSYHLSQKFPLAKFFLSDFSSDALEIAKNINAAQTNFHYALDDVTVLKSYENDQFDLVFCWQTLSWLDDAAKAVEQLIRIAKPGAKIFASSLFNTEYDVDIYSKVIDHTRPSASEQLMYNYNTFSALTVKNWLKDNAKVKSFALHQFNPGIALNYTGKGLGTQTILTHNNKYLQVSGGMLLNWAVLQIDL